VGKIATTINAYSVSLGLDASEFIDSSKLSRSEVSKLKKDIEAARSPLEQLAVEQDRLKKAYDSGAISLEVYNRLLEEKRRKMISATHATTAGHDALSRLSQVSSIVTASVMALRTSFDVVRGAVSSVTGVVNEFVEVGGRIDEVVDKAANLGLTFNELGSLRFAAKELGGEGALAGMDAAIGKMMKGGFVDPGETAVEAFKRIAEEIRGMTDPAERVQRATEVFGKGGVELVGVLSQGSDKIAEVASWWERTNALTDAQVNAVGEFGDNIDRIKTAIEGIVNAYVAEFAPAISISARELLGVDGTMQSIRAMAKDVAEYMIAAAGVAKDIAAEGKNALALDPFGTGGMASSMVRRGAGVDSATSMLQEFYQEKQRLETEAASKTTELRVKQQTKEIDDELQSRKNMEREAADAKWEMAKQEIEREKREREKAEREQNTIRNKNMSLLQSAYRQIEEENKRGPATAVFGTSEYTKAFAQSMNAGKTGKPTDEQILERAKEQLETQKAQDQKLAELLTKTGELVTVSKENGFRRIN